MNEKKYVTPISLMVEELIKNPKTIGFPVAAVFMHNSWQKYEVSVNKKSVGGETDVKNHAETLCYFNLKNNDSKYIIKKILIITLPPCSGCLNIISENKNINWEIYYLFDDVRQKMSKPYLKQFNDDSNKIEILDFSKFKSINLKLEVYFIIMLCLKRFLKQRLIGITKDEIEDIALKWLKKLDKDIEDFKPELNLEIKKEVQLMIKKTKEWNVSEMVYLKDKKGKEKWIV